MKTLVLVLLTTIALTGCVSKEKKLQGSTFEAALEAETGHRYRVVKYDTEQRGFMVFKNETTGKYEAYNMSKWDPATMSTYANFSAIATASDRYIGLERQTETEYVSGADGYESTTYIYYTYGSLRFENASTMTKDLEYLASLRDEAATAYLTHRFKSEFSLSSS
jgi:hypothetical protein